MLCIKASLGNCDQNISCLSIYSTCPFIPPARPAVPFCLSHTDTYVYVPVLGITCVCIAMELRMHGTQGSLYRLVSRVPCVRLLGRSNLSCVRSLITCHQVIILTPPYFCAYTESIADVANAPMSTHPHHHLLPQTQCATVPQASMFHPSAIVLGSSTTPALNSTDVYIDDFMIITHKPNHLLAMHRLLTIIDNVF